MDELSQFTGAPKALVANEARLIEHADIVFTGGYNLGDKKRNSTTTYTVFGCGVEFDHFNKAQDAAMPIPPDIDFMQRTHPRWFGGRGRARDYPMVGEMARIARTGPLHSSARS
jgi:hypothetical protein